ncbi:unnamed protein product [Scytosiphon promiscuus]
MGCSGSKGGGAAEGGGGGRGAESYLAPLPSLRTLSMGKAKEKSFGLSRSLAWIQEKNFEDKFDVVRVIGQGSIGEVSIVRRKYTDEPSGSSAHGSLRASNSKENLPSSPSLPAEPNNGGGGVAAGAAAPATGNGEASEGELGAMTASNADRLYAMKSIHMTRLSKSRVQEFENEVSMLQQLHHPNIIQLREVFYHKKKIYMCMTLCTGECHHGLGTCALWWSANGSAPLVSCPSSRLSYPCVAQTSIRAACGQLNDRSFTESQICTVMSQVIRALVYMHETAKICHRDLKMENIMLESPDDPLVVKLIDFGLSKVFTEGDKMRTACGTVYTMAPEVLTGAGYTQKADLWSAGVIAFVLLSGSFPFLKDEADLGDKDKVDQLAQARFYFNSPSWKTVSAGAKGFVRGLLKKQPGFRWTAREALDYCSDVWGPTFLRASFADLSEQADLAAAEQAAASIGGGGGGNGRSRSRETSTVLSPNGTPRAGGGAAQNPLLPLDNSTHAARGRLKAVNGSIAKSMRRFADYGELKKAALMVTAFQLDRGEIRQLKDAFLEVDTQGNGAISLEELRTVLCEHGVDVAEVDRVFGAVDMDSSGRLHYMEFLAATIEARGYIEEESLKDAFERLDVDSTGFISRDNLKAVLGKTYDNALIDKMLEEGDSSLSGSIEWEDFLGLMRPVVAQEHRKEAEAMLKDAPSAGREAAEMGRRAVDQTPSYAQSKASDGAATAAATTSSSSTTTMATATTTTARTEAATAAAVVVPAAAAALATTDPSLPDGADDR